MRITHFLEAYAERHWTFRWRYLAITLTLFALAFITMVWLNKIVFPGKIIDPIFALLCFGIAYYHGKFLVCYWFEPSQVAQGGWKKSIRNIQAIFLYVWFSFTIVLFVAYIISLLLKGV